MTAAYNQNITPEHLYHGLMTASICVHIVCNLGYEST